MGAGCKDGLVHGILHGDSSEPPTENSCSKLRIWGSEVRILPDAPLPSHLRTPIAAGSSQGADVAQPTRLAYSAELPLKPIKQHFKSPIITNACQHRIKLEVRHRPGSLV